jgi:hypothetical protein
VSASLKVKAQSSSQFIKPQEMQGLFHDLMDHSAQIIDNLKKGRGSQRPYFPCQTMLISYEALYDTGANISCINEDIFRKIPVQNKLPMSMEHSPKQLTTDGG